jgi:hypothetical protein
MTMIHDEYDVGSDALALERPHYDESPHEAGSHWRGGDDDSLGGSNQALVGLRTLHGRGG